MSSAFENVGDYRRILSLYNNSADVIFRKTIRVRNMLSGDLARFAIGCLSILVLFSCAWPFMPRTYTSFATIVFRISEVPGESSGAEAMTRTLDTSAVQSELDRLQSPAMAKAVVQDLHLIDDPDFHPPGAKRKTEADLASQLQRQLVVVREPGSYTVTFGYVAGSAHKSVELTRSLMRVFLKSQIERKRVEMLNATDWMRGRLQKLQDKAQTSQSRVTDILEKSGMIDGGAQSSLEQQLLTLSQEIASAKARLIDTETRSRTLIAMREQGRLQDAPEILSSSVIQNLRASLAKETSSQGAFAMQKDGLNAAIDTESNSIVEGLKTEARNWAIREEMLRSEINSLREQLTSRRRADFGISLLKREADADALAIDDAKKRLNDLMNRTNDVRPDVEIIGEAEAPLLPTAPSLMRYAMTACFVALLVGIALIWNTLAMSLRRLLLTEAKHD